MINHGRTLLLNQSGAGYVPGFGEEYVPPAYRQLRLPSYLDKLRQYFFTAGPDRVFLNYRARQILAMLHATELVEFLTNLDPRVTYDVANADLYGLSWSLSEGVVLSGAPAPPDVTGKMYYQFQCQLAAGELLIQQSSPRTAEDTVSCPLASGCTPVIPLLDSGLSAQFYSFSSAFVKDIAGFAAPQGSLGHVLADLDAGADPLLLLLFGVGNASGAREPYVTFRKLWEQHQELPYRLGGLVLAMIYRTEEVRLCQTA